MPPQCTSVCQEPKDKPSTATIMRNPTTSQLRPQCLISVSLTSASSGEWGATRAHDTFTAWEGHSNPLEMATLA